MDRRHFLGVMAAGTAWAASPAQADLEAELEAARSVVVLGERQPEVALGSEFMARTRLSPCSSFKIPLALMALEEGLVTDADQLVDVDPHTFTPEPWWTAEIRNNWNRPHSLRTAFHASAIWFFRRLALQLGPQRMAVYLARFDYGNRDFSFGIDNFWNAGDRGIAISPEEQWHFLSKVARGSLPLKPSTLQTASNVFVTERQGDVVLRAKTGLGWRSAAQSSPAIGWYIGWVDRPQGVLPFASLSTGPSADDVRLVRVENARRLLRERGAIG